MTGNAHNTPLATPADVLAFWREAGPARWYAKDDAFDAEMCKRFMATWEAAKAGQLTAWEATDDGTLALIIVLDQFSRNMFRNDPRAFCVDELARDVADRAISRGVDQRTDKDLCAFIYLPFEHSEKMEDQVRSVALFTALGDAESLKWADLHLEIIRRFGRFPHRNQVLGRDTTVDEATFLAEGGFAG